MLNICISPVFTENSLASQVHDDLIHIIYMYAIR